ncbi:MAG: hypothetical protein ACXAEU_08955 [Candidatus Hodarchaeales archaeon]|jgi:hypothetical protein
MSFENSWEESQSYLAFVASSFYFTNAEDKKFAKKLLKKNDLGKKWTNEELDRMKMILNRRRKQVGSWEHEVAISRSGAGNSSYRDFEA